MQILILVLTFLAIYELSNRIKISPWVGAGITALTPFFFVLIIRSIRGYDLIRWYDIAMVALFFVSYWFVFHKSQHDDAIVSWVSWGVVGLVIVPIMVIWLLSQAGNLLI